MKDKLIPRHPAACGGKIYIRNSGRDGRNMIAPETQFNHSAEICERLGGVFHKESDVYDEGEGIHSAFKRNNLDQFDLMIEEAIADPKCRYIVTFDSARLVRNVEAGNSILKRIELNGLEWHTFINGRLSLMLEEFRLKTQVLFILDEEESRRTTYRLIQNHYNPAREKGLYFSHHSPLGLSRFGSVKFDTLRWETNEDFKYVLMILDLFNENTGTPTIFTKLKPYRTLKGKSIGLNMVQGVIYRLERYKPFLDADLFERTVRQIENRKFRKRNQRRQVHPSLLLGGLIYCRLCGEKLRSYTRAWGRENKLSRYYRHVAMSCVSAHNVSLKLADNSFWEHMRVWENLSQERKDEIRQALARRKQETEETPKLQFERVAALEKELSGLIRMSAQELISDTEFIAARNGIREELGILKTAPAPNKVFVVSDEQIEVLLNLKVDAMQKLFAYDPTKFNQFLRMFICRVVVENGEVVNVEYDPEFQELLGARVTD